MKTPTNRLFIRLATMTAVLLGLALLPAQAEFVYVTSLTSNCVSGADCNLPNFDLNPTTGLYVYNDNSLGNYTSARSSAEGKPTTSGARYFSLSFSNTTPDFGITLSPALSVPGGVYKIHHVFSSAAGNVSTNVVLAVTNTAGCTLSFTNTDKFQSKYGNSTWQFLGYLTNHPGSANPSVTFYYESGTVDAGAQRRLLVDTFRFSDELCLEVPVVRPVGPLAANLNTVGVSGVSTNATKLTVYQNAGSGMLPVGSTNISINSTGVIQVPVTGLLKGAQVAATQTIGGQEGCVPPTGFFVGGGANPSVRIAFSIRANATLTGPVGAPGSGANIFFLGASNVLSGTAPDLGAIIEPSTNWQTITFTRGDTNAPVDPSVRWNGTGDFVGEFGGLDGLAIASQGDPGPIEMYIDDLANGTNGIVQDWESQEAGVLNYQFNNPGYSGSTSGNILSAPSSSVVTAAAASSGTKSLLVKFEFSGLETNKWLRLVTSGAGGSANPQLDLNEPISIKVLLLPPGVSPVSPLPPAISVSRSGEQVTLSWSGTYQLVSSTSATGPYNDVPGVTNSPYSTGIGGNAMFFRLKK